MASSGIFSWSSITMSGRAELAQNDWAAMSSWRARAIEVPQSSEGAMPTRPLSESHRQ